MNSATTTIAYLILVIFVPISNSYKWSEIPESDADLFELALNLEYLEAEFFLFGSLGYGLDKFAPNLSSGGPPPLGAQMAKLDFLTRDIIQQFAWQEVGHLRAIKNITKGFPRPLLDLRVKSFAEVMNKALGRTLNPPFNPYVSSLNFLIASYLVPYVGLTGYVGANPKLKDPQSRKLLAGLLAVESGQDAVIRALLFQRATERVYPYGITVAEFTDRISKLRNKLGGEGRKDEGIIGPACQGAEGKVTGNVLAGDDYSVGYSRTPEEILRIIYGGGDEHVPGGFYPNGAYGNIAKSFLK
ncbi:desiccation-related protein PCC13-62-like [Euphorbia lathyris]|uniref:desiccation-related protein PCC13-62-like n=1 Tax=Euphorbia lathyris TaxID=212925 RepID=UPI003313DCA3